MIFFVENFKHVLISFLYYKNNQKKSAKKLLNDGSNRYNLFLWADNLSIQFKNVGNTFFLTPHEPNMLKLMIYETLKKKKRIGESENRRIGESENRRIGESENQRIRESENQRIGESENQRIRFFQ